MFFDGLANIHKAEEWGWSLILTGVLVLLAFLIARLYPWIRPTLIGIGVSCLIMTAGVWLNIMVMAANGGKMPVRAARSTIDAIVKYPDGVHVPESPATRLRWLSDTFDLNSAGDRLLDIGYFGFQACLLGIPLIKLLGMRKRKIA
jgi:hypothetical protein